MTHVELPGFGEIVELLKSGTRQTCKEYKRTSYGSVNGIKSASWKWLMVHCA